VVEPETVRMGLVVWPCSLRAACAISSLEPPDPPLLEMSSEHPLPLVGPLSAEIASARASTELHSGEGAWWDKTNNLNPRFDLQHTRIALLTKVESMHALTLTYVHASNALCRRLAGSIFGSVGERRFKLCKVFVAFLAMRRYARVISSDGSSGPAISISS